MMMIAIVLCIHYQNSSSSSAKKNPVKRIDEAQWNKTLHKLQQKLLQNSISQRMLPSFRRRTHTQRMRRKEIAGDKEVEREIKSEKSRSVVSDKRPNFL